MDKSFSLNFNYYIFFGYLYLIFVYLSFGKLFFALLLKCNNNQSDENVYKKERKDYKVNYIKERHFHSVAWQWTVVCLGRLY